MNFENDDGIDTFKRYFVENCMRRWYVVLGRWQMWKFQAFLNVIYYFDFWDQLGNSKCQHIVLKTDNLKSKPSEF